MRRGSSTKLQPVPRETVFSFVSRTAAAHQVRMADYCCEIGTSYHALIRFDAPTIQAIGGAMGLERERVDDLVSWTGSPIAGMRSRFEFRREVVLMSALPQSEARGCVECMREDIGTFDGSPTAAIAMRGDWAFKPVAICLRHEVPLVPLWIEERLGSRHDIAACIRKAGDGLLRGDEGRRHCTPSPYDRWLDEPLDRLRDDTGLAERSLHAVAEFCYLLGRELLQFEASVERTPFEAYHSAQAIGFDAARNGDEAIDASLARLAEVRNGKRSTARDAFGRMFRAFDDPLRQTGLDPAFEHFRVLIRDAALKHWSVAPGTDVLGETVTERRIHSLRSASIAAGIDHKALRRILIDAGIVDQSNEREPARVIFSAEDTKEILGAIPHLATLNAMSAALGIPRHELGILRDEGLLSPRIDPAVFRKCWLVADGVALVERLLRDAEPLDADDGRWVQILRAFDGARGFLLPIVAGVEDGTIRAGRRTDLHGFASVFVSVEDVRTLLFGKETHVSRPPIARSVFADHVGLGDGGTFMALLKDGHTPATVVTNPRTGRRRTYVTEGDAAAFHARFVTPTTLAREKGGSPKAASVVLQRAGIAPFTADGVVYPKTYLRSDVEAVICRLGPDGT